MGLSEVFREDVPRSLLYGACVYARDSDKALPDWVGELEGNADYSEILRGAGVSVPVYDAVGESVARARAYAQIYY